MADDAPRPKKSAGSRGGRKHKDDLDELPLTPKELRFIQEYPLDLNATQAALRSGFCAEYAKESGYKLLQRPKVKEAIDSILAERAMRAGVRADHVLVELGRLAFANMMDFVRLSADGEPYVDLSNITREQAAAIQEVTSETFTEGRGEDAREVRRVKLKLAPKTPALESLGKHLGMYIERHAHAFGALGNLSDEQIAAATAELATQFGLAPTVAGAKTETRH